MPQDERTAFDLDLGIVADARPARCGARGIGIVVAAEQVLGSVEPGQQRRDISRPPGDITQMPDDILHAHDGVPAADQFGIHLGHTGEGSLVDVDRAVIAEMRVGGEEDGHVQ